MRKRQFGELESCVIQQIKKKKRASVKDVYNSFNKDIAYTTVMTVMNRLFEKTILNREKQGRNFIYWLSDESKSYFSNLLNKLKQKVFSGDSVEIVSHLLEDSSAITLEELEKIDKLIQIAKKKKK